MGKQAVHVIENPPEKGFDAFSGSDIDAEHQHVGKLTDDGINPFDQGYTPESRNGEPELFGIERPRQRHGKNTEQQGRHRYGATPRSPFKTVTFNDRKHRGKTVRMNGA